MQEVTFQPCALAAHK